MPGSLGEHDLNDDEYEHDEALLWGLRMGGLRFLDMVHGSRAAWDTHWIARGTFAGSSLGL
jgi:hypothetical protein